MSKEAQTVEQTGSGSMKTVSRGWVRPFGASRLLRKTAGALCALLLLESAPIFAVEVALRAEPRGWPQLRDWAEASAQAAKMTLASAATFGSSFSPFSSPGSQAGEPSSAKQPKRFGALPPSPPGFGQKPAAKATGQPAITAAALAALAAKDAAVEVPILPAWNLVSLPARPIDASPASVFGPLGTALHRVYAYDACDSTDPWKVYDPADLAVSDLDTADEHSGLWVEASGAGTLPSLGDPPLGTTIHLCPGWNLVGFPAAEARPVANALVTIAGKYSRVFGYDASDASDPWEVYDVAAPSWANDLQLLRPGRGYWILATAAADLSISNQGTQLAVDISQPAQLQEVTSPMPVIGTAQGQALASWELRYRSVEEGFTWTTLATGTSPVSNALLATFDPTLLLNGMYEIELSALDGSGGGVSLSTHVLVEGQQKIGNFAVSFVDLEIPLAGIPIQVVRTYDSREKRGLDFGYGWTLGVRQGSYRNNRKPGEGWRIVKGFVPCQVAQETKPHLTTIRLSDREIYRFRLSITRPAITQGGCFAEAGFAFVDGPVPGAQLSILGGTELFYANGSSDVVDASSLEPYEPKKVRLTTRDGRVFDLDAAQGLTRIVDANGNTLQISDTGISHSSGKSVSWTRDSAGRITTLTDPMGESLTYGYDVAGDLVEVTDRASQTTRFTYNSSHGLLTIEDPRGIQPLRNEYDASGRLIRHIDAFGKTIELTHDLADQREVITDRLGHSLTFGYNERGNVIEEIDALSHATHRAFDDNDLLISETDPLGHATSYSYDAGRNLIELRDPLGHTTRYTYDGAGRVLTTTDPLGKVTRNQYDGAGNLLQTTDALGHVTASTYDTRGNPLTQTDALGGVTSFSYDGFGNLTAQTDGLGTVTNYIYDSNSNRLTESTTRTLTRGGHQTLQTTMTYDGLGRVVATTHPDGSHTSTVYNSIGQVGESIDALGRHTTFTYDDLGRQISTRYPDGTSASRTYDAESRLLSRTDRAGHPTTFTYDAVGRMTQTTFADGSTTSRAYDESGRLVTSTDARGNATTYVYDAAGRRTRVVDALAGQTALEYDAAGRQLAVTDPNRQRTSYAYDDAGRLVRTDFADGTGRQVTYDALGRRIAETDPAGRATQFGSDALGRLLTVTDALDQVTRYSYDEVGSRLTQTDANYHTTSFEYDAMGRMSRRVLPDGSAESMTYDLGGNLTGKTDFAGRTIQFGFDLANRLTLKTYPDSTTVGFTYMPNGRRATMVDARGTTSYSYDTRDRLLEVVYPGGAKLGYAWDANGNRTSLTATVAGQVLTSTYTYDVLNRLATVTDPRGEVFRHGYDANGNRTSLVYPNGVQTSYVYDPLNRLKELRTATSVGTLVQGYLYTLGAAGNRTKIEEGDGTIRSYTYDSLYRLTAEGVARSGATLYGKTFQYDPVGNRLKQQHTDPAGTVTTTNASFDTRDRQLIRGAQAWTWDANGNLTAKVDEAIYAWDFDDRLKQVVLQDGTVIQETYDADGVLVRSETQKPGGANVAIDYFVSNSGALSQVVAETTAGALSAYYVRGDDLLAVMRPRVAPGPWVSRFYHADGLGSIRTLTDEAASVTDRYEFSAFGELLHHDGEDANAYLFAGEMLDPNSGFHYNRARWMDTGVGRFASVDPFGGRPANAITLHKYLYANDDPVSLSDPTGRFALSFGQLVGILAAVYALGSLAISVTGIFRVFQKKRPISVRTQVFIVTTSGWSDDEAAAVMASASSLWSRLAGISVVPTSITFIRPDERLNVVTKFSALRAVEAIEALGPTEKHVTVFVPSCGLGDAGTSLVGRYFKTNRAYTFFSGEWWVPHTVALAHEWGHTFDLHDSWIALNLMGTTPYGPTLTSSQIDHAREYARTF